LLLLYVLGASKEDKVETDHRIHGEFAELLFLRGDIYQYTRHIVSHHKNMD